MNVGKLKKILEGIPDNTIIVSEAYDHHYELVYNASSDNIIKYNREYFEYNDDVDLEPGELIVRALVIE